MQQIDAYRSKFLGLPMLILVHLPIVATANDKRQTDRGQKTHELCKPSPGHCNTAACSKITEICVFAPARNAFDSFLSFHFIHFSYCSCRSVFYYSCDKRVVVVVGVVIHTMLRMLPMMRICRHASLSLGFDSYSVMRFFDLILPLFTAQQIGPRTDAPVFSPHTSTSTHSIQF